MTTNKLFFVTSISDLLIEEILKNPGALVITPFSYISTKLFDDAGIASHAISGLESPEEIERDVKFKSLFMPGEYEGLLLDGKFPAWKSLALDRLRFWFDDDKETSLLNLLIFDHLYITMDIEHRYPWSLALKARERGIRVTGIKTRPIRTREFYDFLPYIPLDNAIVSFKDEQEFIGSRCPNVSVTYARERPGRNPVEYRTRKELRGVFGISESDFVSGVVFDKRDEWQARTVLNSYSGNIVIFPYDQRSEDLYEKCIPAKTRKSVRLCDDFAISKMCDNLIMFRFLEDVYMSSPDIPTLIFDLFNLNLSKELAIGCHVQDGGE